MKNHPTLIRKADRRLCSSFSCKLLLASVFAVALPPSADGAAREWSDATGKFHTQAEFVAVRKGKVIPEKANGEIISLPLEKLSAADRAYVSSQTAQKPALPAKPEAPAGGEALAQKTEAILRANCYRCHGQDGASEGGLNRRRRRGGGGGGGGGGELDRLAHSAWPSRASQPTAARQKRPAARSMWRSSTTAWKSAALGCCLTA